MDKRFWQGIVENDCVIPEGQTVEVLTPELLEMLGSTDPDLRDEVAYMVFARWIVRDEHYSVDDLRGLITTLTGNLRQKIGEHETGSVLLRSFSALVLSLVAYYDVQKQVLTGEEIHSLLDSALTYLTAEQDLRGYVVGLGWHHAVAHTADLLKFLARNPKTGGDDHQRILNAIFEKLSAAADYVYIHDEDERLTLTVYDVLRRDTIDWAAWETWLGKFATWKTETVTGGGFVPTIHAPYQNCKAFLRSLYFTLTVIADEKQDTGLISERAKAILPEVLKILRIFGMGTIYGG